MVDDQSDLFKVLYEALRMLPAIEVVTIDHATAVLLSNRSRQRSVRITSGSTTLELVPIMKREVFPRDARMLLWNLHQHQQRTQQDQPLRVPIVVAEGISTGARSILREAATSYFDRTGSIYIQSQGLYLFVDRPVPKRLLKLSNALFTRLRQRIIYRLLEHPGIWFSVADLAGRTGASAATTSQTLLLLEKHEWVETTGRGPTKRRRLVNPIGLTQAWADERKLERRKTAQRFYVAPPPAGQTLALHVARHCAGRGVMYALTDLVAGQLHLARSLTAAEVTCYLAFSDTSTEFFAALGSVPKDKGNLTIFPIHDHSTCIEHVSILDMEVVAPITAYIDLMACGEIAMAAEIRKTLLAF